VPFAGAPNAENKIGVIVILPVVSITSASIAPTRAVIGKSMPLLFLFDSR
jgi:hypothetical protein